MSYYTANLTPIIAGFQSAPPRVSSKGVDEAADKCISLLETPTQDGEKAGVSLSLSLFIREWRAGTYQVSCWGGILVPLSIIIR